MTDTVRVYMVEKSWGQDVLTPKQEREGRIPNKVDKVYITWGDGKEGKEEVINREEFLTEFGHIEGCYWVKN